MEMKWYCIAVAVVISVVSISEAVDKWQHNQCKIELAKSTTKTAEQIEAVCGK